MEVAATIFAAWSAGIFAVIAAVGRTPISQAAWWARLLPVLPLIIGGISGPTVVPMVAEHLPWITGVGAGGAVLIGIGAGAVAASGHSAHRQTIRGRDRRIGHQGEGRGGEPYSSGDIADALTADGGDDAR